MALIGGTPFDDNDVVRPALRGTNFFDQIFAKEGNDTLYGNGGNDLLYGEAGDDFLAGGEGNDTHYGGPGDDLMSGISGNDTYYVDSPGDIVLEGAGFGNDTVYTSVNYTLTSNVENLILTGNAYIGYGNSLSNEMTVQGTSGLSNRLYGRSGNDTLNGNSGIDYLYGENQNDLLKGFYGDDHLFGGFGNDTLYGHYDNDELDGGNNDDLLYGGRGTDTLKGGAGRDTLWGTESIFHNDIDELSGGADADIFAFGVKRAVHYWRGDGYGLVKDFNRFEDTIQLAGGVNRGDYSLQVGNWDGGTQDTGVLYQGNLIAVVSGQIGLNLNANYFSYST